MSSLARLRRPLVKAARDAMLVTTGCVALGLGVNALRPHGLPVVQKQPYRILVPCPDLAGRVEGMDPADPRLKEKTTLLVDARSASEYQKWHLDQARSIPYDFLEPVAEKMVRSLVASGASRVVIYGDGADPDPGRELARELAAQGIRHIYHVAGGAPALGANGR